MPVLRVKMLGTFLVFFDDIEVVTSVSRNSKVLSLLQYFLCHKNKVISSSELINAILGEDLSVIPMNTIKNLVYRTRKLFYDKGIDWNCIECVNGGYVFNNDVDFDIDTDKFLDLYSSIINNEKDSSFELCISAINLYNGKFDENRQQPWMFVHTVEFHEKYIDILKITSRKAVESNNLRTLLPYLSKAFEFSQHDEDIYLLYLDCLCKLNMKAEAKKIYNDICELLFTDLGVEPSTALISLGHEIYGKLHRVNTSIEEVHEKLIEKPNIKGPYFCSIDTFTDIYNLFTRQIERSDQTVCLLLCTLSEIDGQVPSVGDRAKKHCGRF